MADSQQNTPSGLTPEQQQVFQTLQENAPPTAAQQAPPIQNANPLAGIVSMDTFKQAKEAMQYIGDGYDMSEDDVNSSIGWNKALLGQISNEDAQNLYNPDAVQMARKNRVLKGDAEHTIDFQHFDLLRAAKEIVDVVPYLKQEALNAGIGSLAVGSAFAAHGSIVGSEATTFLAPFTEGVSIPAGAAAGAVAEGTYGAALGARGGVLKTAAELGAGSTYRDMINNGVEPETARTAAIAAGTLGGVMQAWFLHNPITKLVPLYAEIAKETTAQVFSKVVWTVEKGVIATDVQQAGSLAIDYLVSKIDKHEPMPTWGDVWNALEKSTLKGELVGLTTAVAGLALNRFNVKRPGPITQQMKMLTTALDEEATQEAKEQKLFGMKVELDVAKAEEKLSKANAKLAEAQKENKPVKAAKLAAAIAKEELSQAKEALSLKGKVTLNAGISISKERNTSAVKNAEKKVAELQEAIKNLKGEEKTQARRDLIEANKQLKRREIERTYADKETPEETKTALVDDAKEDLKATINRALKLNSEGKSTVPIETRKIIAEYKALIDDAELPEEATKKHAATQHLAQISFDEVSEKKAQALTQQGEEPSLEDEHKLIIAADVIKLQNANVKQIFALTAKLEDLIKTGKDSLLAKIKAAKAERQALSKEVETAVNGEIEIRKKREVRSENPVANTNAQFIRSFGVPTFRWEGTLRNAIIDSSDKSVLRKLYLAKTVRETRNHEIELQKLKTKHLLAATGKTKHQIEQLLKTGAEQKLEINSINQKGTNSTWHLTINQAVELLAHLKDPTLYQTTGYTNERDLPGKRNTELVIEEALQKEGKGNDYLNLMYGYLNFYQDEEVFPILSKAYEDQYHLPLPRNPNYPGFTYREGFKDEDLFNQFVVEWGKQANDQRRALAAKRAGATYTRTSDSPLKPMDIDQAANQYIANMAQYVGWAEEAKKYNTVFKNPTTRMYLEEKFGKIMNEALDSHLRHAIRGRVDAYDGVTRWFDGVLRAKIITDLALKPTQTIKHAANIVNYRMFLPSYADLGTGVTSYFQNQKTANALVTSTPGWKQKYSDQSTAIIGFKVTDPTKLTPDGAILYWSMASFKFGSMAADAPGMWAVYTHAVANGATKKEAIDAADDALAGCSPSGAIDTQSMLSRNPVGRLINAFHSAINYFVERNILATQDYAAFPTTENFGKMAAQYFHSAIAVSLFATVNALTAELLGESKKEIDEAWFRVRNSFIDNALWPIAEEGMIDLWVAHHNIFKGKGESDFHVWDPSGSPMLDAVHSTFVDLPRDVFTTYKNNTWDARHITAIALDLMKGPLPLLARIGTPVVAPTQYYRKRTEPPKKGHLKPIGL
jgi:hypothetical protein